MPLTIEQQRAIATAKARKAAAMAQVGKLQVQPNLSGMPGFGPLLAAVGYDGMPRPTEGEYAPSMIPALDPVNAFATKAIENIPVVGPALDRFGNQVDAGFASALEGKQVTPEDRAAINQADQGQYPVAAAAGAVTGTVGPFMAAGATNLGAKMLGLTGPLWSRMAAGAGSGGVISYLDSVARGDSQGEAGLKTAIGAMTGGTFPMAERGVAAVIQALAKTGAPKSAQVVARGLERDKIDPAAIVAKLREIGPEAVLADLGPNMTRQAGALASLPGEAQTLVRDALVARNAGANSRIQQSVDQALGPAPIPAQVNAEIKSLQRALEPEYRAALSGAKAVDATPIANELDAFVVNSRGEAQSVAKQVRQMLNVTGTAELDPNPATLLEVRKAIDGMFDTVQDGNARRVLSQTRKAVDAMLAAAAPGIKEVDAKYATLAQQREAFEQGQTALDSGRTSMRPQELADAAQNTAPEIFAYMSKGARADIDRVIGTTANNITALKTALKGDGSWNRDRLVTLFGADKADRLLGILEREAAYQRTFNAVTQNSETAARVAAQKDVSPTQFGERPTNVLDLAMRIPQAALNAGARARSDSVNKQIAEALMSQPKPEMIDQLLVARAMANRKGLIAPGSTGMLLTNQGS